MPLMIKLNRNVVRVYLCLDNGHFITVFTTALSVTALFFHLTIRFLQLNRIRCLNIIYYVIIFLTEEDYEDKN